MKRFILFAMVVFVAKLAGAQSVTESPVASETSADDPSLLVYVDVKPACPRRGCWAATNEAILRLPGVKSVDMGAMDSTLRPVQLSHSGLPDPKEWETQFREYVGTASEFRGVVVTITGTILPKKRRLCLEAPGIETLDLTFFGRRLLQGQSLPSESQAQSAPENSKPIFTKATITGVLKKGKKGYCLEVHQFELLPKLAPK